MTQDTSAKYIELNTFLKIFLKIPTGGQAKVLIREGKVKVNDQIETRNKRKLHAGDIIELENQKIELKAEMIK